MSYETQEVRFKSAMNLPDGFRLAIVLVGAGPRPEQQRQLHWASHMKGLTLSKLWS